MSDDSAQIRWHVDAPPDPAEVQELRKKLQGFNIANSTVEEGQALGVFLRDEAGEMLGGASGWLWGNCLEIDFLWIAGALRGQGIGRQLMLELERVAILRGARLAIVDTFSFQAPVFYQRLGYQTFGLVEGYGDKYAKHFMRKGLRWLR